MILLFITALILSFILSGLETAMLSVSRVRVRHAADAKDPRAVRLLPMLDARDGVIGVLTVANHSANVIAFSYITWKLVQAFGAWGYVIGFLLALPIFIIGLELLPKNLFRRYPFRALVRCFPVLNVAWLFQGLFKTVPTPPVFSDATEDSDEKQASRDDVTRLIKEMTLSEHLPASVVEIVERVLSSRPLTARELLVPLPMCVSIDAGELAAEALSLARKHRLSCLLVRDPAYTSDAPKFQGVIDVASLPAVLPPDRHTQQHASPLERVEASSSALTVLQRLRRKGVSIALVIDGPDAVPLGIISEEDIIARLLPVRK